MIPENLTIALIQTSLFWEDKERNLNQFDEKIKSITFDCDLILLPEMFSTGFTMNTEKLGEEMTGPTLKWLKEIAKSSKKVISGSFIVKENGKYYNRLVWMRHDGSYEYYDKKHLFRMAKEDAYFAGGNSRLIVELKGWKIRPLICYDLRFPVWSRNTQEIIDGEAVPEFDVLFYVANWPAVRSMPWDVLLRARAVENQVYCLGLNRIGDDGNDKHYNGHSAVISPKGDYLLEPVDEKEGVFKVELSYESLDKFRKKFPQGLDADEFQLSNNSK